jgi:LacI family transcriptional regulator
VGSTVITLYDVARHAGVSTATVSRVLHGQDRVRQSTRARVQQAIEELGYIPDGAAQSLSRRRKEVIGLICCERPMHPEDVENRSLTYVDEMLRGVEHGVSALDWSLLLTFYNGHTTTNLRRILAMSGKVDGILISEGSFPARLTERLAARVPVTIIAGSPDEHDFDVVTADNLAGSAAVVTHLIEDHGVRTIYHVAGPSDAPDAGQRGLGLLRVLDRHPAARLTGATSGAFNVETGFAAGERMLAQARGDLPDAVVAANDQMAIGVLRALTQAGVRVPDEVAVVGFDDIQAAGLYEPQLTTVYQPMRTLGERACALLLERIADPSLPARSDTLATELVIRRSCGCPPGTMIRRPVPPALVTAE